MTTAPFPNRPRVDAREKVTGRLKYAADVAVEGLLYGMMVPSTIARGRVVAVSTDAALAVPTAQVRVFGKPTSHPGRRLAVALAQGDTVDQARERAREAAALVRVSVS